MAMRNGALTEWNGGARIFWSSTDAGWFAWVHDALYTITRKRGDERFALTRHDRRATVTVGTFEDRHGAAADAVKRMGLRPEVDHSWELPAGVQTTLEEAPAVLDAHPAYDNPTNQEATDAG